MLKRFVTITDALFLLVFIFAVIVQVNDSDAWAWMAIGGAAAVACLLSLTDRQRWWFPVVVGIVALAWAATIAQIDPSRCDWRPIPR
jgi:hypothetical protein